MKLERRVGRLLFGPVLQTVGQRKRQFPQHALEPHAADQDADQPDSKMSAGALRRILPPILEGHCNSGDQQRPEQRQDQKAPVSEFLKIAGVRCQELPDIGEGIGHVRVLQRIDRLLSYR